jgi:hypothetical protein
MTTGVQFTGTLTPHQSHQWFTSNWPASSYIVWTVVPTSVQTTPEITWSVAVERQDAAHCTYWITVTNLTAATVNFEGRYAILN